ncbi:hypothetical protein BD408DRAFT_442873 [Parasitella parasitica]|nr:hypothetical protein BD408DRAFT_442873 [Parasitella parasitica]
MIQIEKTTQVNRKETQLQEEHKQPLIENTGKIKFQELYKTTLRHQINTLYRVLCPEQKVFKYEQYHDDLHGEPKWMSYLDNVKERADDKRATTDPASVTANLGFIGESSPSKLERSIGNKKAKAAKHKNIELLQKSEEYLLTGNQSLTTQLNFATIKLFTKKNAEKYTEAEEEDLESIWGSSFLKIALESLNRNEIELEFENVDWNELIGQNSKGKIAMEQKSISEEKSNQGTKKSHSLSSNDTAEIIYDVPSLWRTNGSDA